VFACVVEVGLVVALVDLAQECAVRGRREAGQPLRQRGEGLRQLGDAVVLAQVTHAAPLELAGRAHVGGDHGEVRGEQLEQVVAERLRARSHEAHVALDEQLLQPRLRHFPQELDVAGQLAESLF
jgi:hypothetical protein